MMRKHKDDADFPDTPERPNPPPEDRLMTTQELMAYLSVSRTKLWQLVNNEGLPAIKLGGDYRYRKSKVDAWLDQFEVKPDDSPGAE